MSILPFLKPPFPTPPIPNPTCTQLSLPSPRPKQLDITEKIVSCALMWGGGIFTHPDATNHYDLEDELASQGAPRPIPLACRGFFTNKGNFLSPYDAMLLAEANGQVTTKRMKYRILYASDLWPHKSSWGAS